MHLAYAPTAVARVLEDHYLFLAFLSALGTIQFTASLGGYRGLWLVPQRVVTRWLGIVLFLSGFALFLVLPLWSSGPWLHGSVRADSSVRQWGRAGWSDLPRANNVNDINGGLSGTQQAIWFPTGVAGAFILSVLAGAIGTRLVRGGPEESPTDDGLDLLKSGDYLASLPRSLSLFRTTGRADLTRALAGPGWLRHRFANLWKQEQP